MMPMRLARKAQRLEKIENLCRTATREKDLSEACVKGSTVCADPELFQWIYDETEESF
jgi:hypothetical protein